MRFVSRRFFSILGALLAVLCLTLRAAATLEQSLLNASHTPFEYSSLVDLRKSVLIDIDVIEVISDPLNSNLSLLVQVPFQFASVSAVDRFQLFILQLLSTFSGLILFYLSLK